MTKLTAFRLTDADLQGLDRIVSRVGLSSRAEAIRHAIRVTLRDLLEVTQEEDKTTGDRLEAPG